MGVQRNRSGEASEAWAGRQGGGAERRRGGGLGGEVAKVGCEEERGEGQEKVGVVSSEEEEEEEEAEEEEEEDEKGEWPGRRAHDQASLISAH
ncbi:hypothetical protein E2C01_100845 [Portunus trituberculatus]|uniref:Uncharacterized protein n=1 Tax=Portunus trituberculatus TaxID=210409 RepID=A0A5B7KEM1_PORTR|nr:hypothetical protein [Portunus trituberculatus]